MRLLCFYCVYYFIILRLQTTHARLHVNVFQDKWIRSEINALTST